MSATTVRLLEVACEILGSDAAVAARLGIDELLLAAYKADRRPIPDRVLLAAVDIILTDRRCRQTTT